MGLIKDNIKDENHFLTKYGFKYGKQSGPCGETGFTNTYIHANNSERLWITVNLTQKKAYFYNEFECGGMLSQYSLDIPSDIIDDEKKLIDWLDEFSPND